MNYNMTTNSLNDLSIPQLNSLLNIERNYIYFIRNEHIKNPNPNPNEATNMNNITRKIMQIVNKRESLMTTLENMLIGLQYNRNNIFENFRIRRSIIFNQITNEVAKTALFKSLADIVTSYAIYV